MIRRQAVRTAVKQQLYDWILEGHAAPGLPLKLSDASVHLGVSVTPVREALIELEAESLVTTAPGRGFVVSPLGAREARELYPLISILETKALEAVPAHSAGQLRELDEINEHLMAASGSPAVRVQLDNRWHEALLRDSENVTLLGLLAPLKRRISRYEFQYMKSRGRRVSFSQHAQIAKALREGRRDAAAGGLAANWQSGLTTLEPWLRQLEQAVLVGGKGTKGGL